MEFDVSPRGGVDVVGFGVDAQAHSKVGAGPDASGVVGFEGRGVVVAGGALFQVLFPGFACAGDFQCHGVDVEIAVVVG